MATSDAIAQIKERLSIAELIGAHVALARAGRNLRGLCPFHTEKTPSFYVFPDQGTFHCFGCGAHGDAFTFLMRAQQADFGTVLRDLAQRAGVTLPDRHAAAREDARAERLRQVLEAAARFYQHALHEAREAEPVRAYLAQRGIEPTTQERFQLGYAPAPGDALWRHLRSQGVERPDALAAGLLVERDDGSLGDRFRQRVMFPIRDGQGRLTGFGGRATGESHPKYLNSPQTPLFDKGATLYALDQAQTAIREAGAVVVVEGYVDAIVAQQAGFGNVVASLGTALTERQARQLNRLAGRIVLALDADAAGDLATQRGIEVLIRALRGREIQRAVGPHVLRPQQVVEVELRIVRLPPGQDPDEIISRDPRTWEALCAQAIVPVAYYLGLAAERFDLRAPAGRRSAIALLAPIIDSYDSFDRQHHLQRLALLLGVHERQVVQQLARSSPQTAQARRGQYDLLEEMAARTRGGPPAVERYAIALLLREPGAGALAAQMDAAYLTDPRAHALLAHLLAHRDAGGGVDAEQARATLDEELAAMLDEIDAQATAWLPIDPSALPSTAAALWQHLRLSHLDCEQAQARTALAEAQAVGDVDTARTLLKRIAQINTEVYTLKRAGAQRSATALDALSAAVAGTAATS
ncbi:MAG: DNA primase [Chloroflexi bacterium]|nr:DNA primase [Chloroflexota bacterium]